MRTRRLPPTRTSMLATEMVAPFGPYQAAKCSGTVHICQMSSMGASKRRSITTESCVLFVSVMALDVPSSMFELVEIVVHAVKARLPDGPVLLDPGRHHSQAGRVEGARSVLGALAADDQPGLLQHLDVLGDCRERQVERVCELVDRGRPVGEAGEDRPTRPVR